MERRVQARPAARRVARSIRGAALICNLTSFASCCDVKTSLQSLAKGVQYVLLLWSSIRNTLRISGPVHMRGGVREEVKQARQASKHSRGEERWG